MKLTTESDINAHRHSNGVRKVTRRQQADGVKGLSRATIGPKCDARSGSELVITRARYRVPNPLA